MRFQSDDELKALAKKLYYKCGKIVNTPERIKAREMRTIEDIRLDRMEKEGREDGLQDLQNRDSGSQWQRGYGVTIEVLEERMESVREDLERKDKSMARMFERLEVVEKNQVASSTILEFVQKTAEGVDALQRRALIAIVSSFCGLGISIIVGLILVRLTH